MTDMEKVFDAFRNCITEPKCKDCPWEQCEQFNQKKVTIPVTLALDVLELLKEQDAKIKKKNQRIWEVTCERDERENVVHCEECAYALFKEGAVEQGHIFCTKPFTERWQAVKPNNWFCADGERREYVKPPTESATDWDGVECE